MKNKQRGFTLTELLISVGFFVAIAGVIGWILNIVTLIHLSLNPMTTEIILRFIGIPLVPLGMVMGYL